MWFHQSFAVWTVGAGLKVFAYMLKKVKVEFYNCELWGSDFLNKCFMLTSVIILIMDSLVNHVLIVQLLNNSINASWLI